MNYQIEALRDWLIANSINHTFTQERVFTCGDQTYLLLLHKKHKVFNPNMSLIIDESELEILDQHSIDRFVILFGDKFYYIEDDDFYLVPIYDEVGDLVDQDMRVKTIRELLYIGAPIEQNIFPHLGVHGGYDLCNGSRLYKDWCKKAKWLGITTLGICEENTLAGALLFQGSCQSVGINSIIGETITIQFDSSYQYHIKLYCKNNTGWINLLQINALLNTSKTKSITASQLQGFSDQLICVLTPTISIDKIIDQYINVFQDIFYQLDFVEWSNSVKEDVWLENLYLYLKEYRSQIDPIALYDSYYLESGDSEVQPVLWRIGKRDNFKYRSSDRYFKTSNQYIKQALSLFDDDNQSIIVEAIENAKVFDQIDFRIPTGQKHLPQYELTEEEKLTFNTSEDLFWDLINKGLQEKVIDRGLDLQVYLDRVQEEVRVINLGQVQDYFLIVWDMISYCNRNNILVGTGRGSAAGCLVSYLLGIVQIDPIHYDLLFERFINEGRIGKSLPDIDNDIMGSRREEVKRYLENRYGVDYVSGIGTYGTFKIRAALKDLIREIGGDGREANYISAIIEAEDSFFTLFTKALDPSVNPRLLSFIKKHSYQISCINKIFHQPKTSSVHAAGIIIVPKQNGTIYQQLPVKEMDGIVITEWEGQQIEDAGFLKVDVLGLKQLDKFDEIIKLVYKNRKQNIVLNNIPLDIPGVYSFFQKGFNEDVFQFGGGGLRSYCKVLRPDNIEDLIATVALYRPGPIEIGAHEKYAKTKNGELELDYYFGLEQITKSTYSQIVYQEQIMKIVQELGGFSLVEADNIRKAMGKKLLEVMVKYKEQFIQGAINKGCPSDEALQIWMDMEGFAGYAFNRSHAACYGITGYYSQWLKYSYPLEFWLTSLKYAKDDEIQSRLSEIKHIAEGIFIKGPDVMKSQRDYYGDVESNTIYWSLNSIKFVGESALKDIERIRVEKSIVDFEDFIVAVMQDKELKKTKLQPGERIHSPINRRVICHLIIAGAFDNLENITQPQRRADLLIKYFEILHPELKSDALQINEKLWRQRMGDYYDLTLFHQEHKWIMEQRNLCGFGNIDFHNLLTQLPYKNRGLFHENNDILQLDLSNSKVIAAGIVEQVTIRKSRNGEFVQILIHDGFSQLFLTVWSEVYQQKAAEINESKGKILFMDGEVVYDPYKKSNVVHSKSYTNLQIL